jgi:hypothetical protein
MGSYLNLQKRCRLKLGLQTFVEIVFECEGASSFRGPGAVSPQLRSDPIFP